MKNKKHTFKYWIGQLHLWLGLASGVIVLILGFTGCLFVFQQEISSWIRHDVYYVIPQEEVLPVEELQQRAAAALGVRHLPYGLTTHKDPERAWSAMYYEGGVDAWTYFGTIKDYRTAYINPYTGEITDIINEENDFFQIVKGIHWSLLLATPIGQPVVAWSSVIFIVLVLTGMVLWWPKRWDQSHRKKSFTIKWRGSKKRVNYDLHNVLGFYFLIIIFILGATGLYWAFPFAKKSLYFLGTGEFRLPPPPAEKVISRPAELLVSSPMEIAYEKAWKEYPRAFSISLTAPVDSSGTIQAFIRPDGETYYQNSQLQFDQYNGKLLARNTYAAKNTGERLLAMNYDIHVGAIAGMPGKIMAFLGSLVSASLPVTGFIIWWGKRKKDRKRISYNNSKDKLRTGRIKLPEKISGSIKS